MFFITRFSPGRRYTVDDKYSTRHFNYCLFCTEYNMYKMSKRYFYQAFFIWVRYNVNDKYSTRHFNYCLLRVDIMIVSFILLFCLIQSANGLSSPITPFTNYDHSVELQTNVSDLWWTVNETNQTILFELHIKTTGWIALGISPGK